RSQHAPATDARHDDVESDRRGANALCQREAPIAIGGEDDFESFLAQHASHQVANVWIVVYDKDPVVLLVNRRGNSRRPGGATRTVPGNRFDPCRPPEREHRSDTRCAGDREISTHHLAEPAPDRETEAGAAVFA